MRHLRSPLGVEHQGFPSNLPQLKKHTASDKAKPKQVGLSYSRDKTIEPLEGKEAGDKTRTCDRLITNQLLYQLSYTSMFGTPSIGQIARANALIVP